MQPIKDIIEGIANLCQSNNCQCFNKDEIKSVIYFIFSYIESGQDLHTSRFIRKLLSKTSASKLIPTSRIEDNRIALKKSQIDDFRVQSVAMQGFRGLPLSEAFYYGLSFCSIDVKKIDKNMEFKDEVPASTVIIGTNGTGKSSFFNALEHVYTRKIAATLKYGFSNTEDYISNLFCQLEDVNVLVNTPKKMFKYANTKFDGIDLSIVSRHCFSSESEIERVETQDIKKYLSECLGLDILEKIASELQQMIEVVKTQEQRKLTDWQKESEKLWDKAGQTYQEDTPQTGKKLKSLIEALQKRQKLREDLECMKKAVLQYMTDSRAEAHQDVKDILSDLLIESSLNLSCNDEVRLAEDKVKLSDGSSVNIITGDLEIKSKIANTSDSPSDWKRVCPKRYYNNFRLKLYILSLRIAIAIRYMKQYHISLPLVLDDIFDASDFEHRKMASDYFEALFKSYKENVPDLKPLQVILFTQDEMLAKFAYEGICRGLRQYDNGKTATPHILRLFAAVDCSDDDERKLKYHEISDALTVRILADTIK